MKRANQNETSVQTPKFELSIDSDIINELRDLLGQRKKLDEAVNSAPGEISAAQSEMADLRSRLGALEADVVLIDAAKLPALQKEIAKLADTIDAKDLTFRRLKARVDALEVKAPEIDSKIDLAIGYVRVESSIAAESLQVELAETLRNKVAEVRMIYAQVRALQRLVPTHRTSDFLVSAYLPDLESVMRVNTGTGHYDTAPNLLAVIDANTESAEATITDVMRPIADALIMARSHRAYVPLAKRPKPYVFQGSNQGPDRHLGGPIGPGEPPIPVEQPEPAFKGYKVNERYAVKSDMSGKRTRDAAVEMNATPAIATVGKSTDGS